MIFCHYCNQFQEFQGCVELLLSESAAVFMSEQWQLSSLDISYHFIHPLFDYQHLGFGKLLFQQPENVQDHGKPGPSTLLVL